MTKVKDILHVVEGFAPRHLAQDWDNVGLLAGRAGQSVARVLVALDVTMAVIDEAKRIDAQLIVTHHPVIRGLKAITDVADYDQQRMIELLENKIACISAHTNLDSADGGVNDVLAELCGLQNIEVLDRDTRLGRIGCLESPMLASEYSKKLSSVLNCASLRYCNGGKTVSKVAVCGGSGSDIYEIAIAAGCDALITGDVKYHLWTEAAESGVALIDAGHFETEVIICETLRMIIAQQFSDLDVRVSQVMRAPFEVTYAT